MNMYILNIFTCKISKLEHGRANGNMGATCSTHCSIVPGGSDPRGPSTATSVLEAASPDEATVLITHRNLYRKAESVAANQLRNATPELRADHATVLAAVELDGCALRFASYELRTDIDVVLRAVANDGYALKETSPEIQNDFAVCIAACSCYGSSLQFCSERMRGNPSVVTAAIQNRLPQKLNRFLYLVCLVHPDHHRCLP